ncbi:MAG: ABC transporter substrate-binding protein [Bacteroidales bacterium]|nr:ABC transporter substrate-binding protein [Bacteroidales bacterium]
MKHLIIPVLIILMLSCNSRKGEMKTGENISDSVSENLYSRLFTVSHEENFTRMTITSPWQGSGDIALDYFLLPDSGRIPDGADPAMVIRTPVSRVVCMSTTHVAMISRLGFTSTIKAVSGPGYISDKQLLSMISEGSVADIGYDSNINSELIVSLEPDVVLVYGVGAESAGYLSKIRDSGIPLLYISDYLENDPLARAEWLRVFGFLYEKEDEADRIFENIAAEYELLKQEVAWRLNNLPVVMTGLPYKDTWYISPGNSYIGQLISDAGGKYLWSDRRSASAIPMSLESVYVKAHNADIWINSGSAESLDDIVSVDTRLGDLKPVKTGRVFNNNARQLPGGGNDYWEKGVLEPHVLLLDLISVFHPGLVPDNIICYYRRLEWKER